MRHLVLSALAAAIGTLSLASAAHADVATVSFTKLTGLAGVQGTTIFRADLSALSFDTIQSITLIDSNSQSGGSPGAFSGFDLDGIKLSTTLANTAAQASAAAALPGFDFSPANTLFTPGTQRSPVAAKLFGTDASGLNVDPAMATLSQFDSNWFTSGEVTLGDGGKISFNLTAPISTAGLYLYIGEVGGSLGENVSGTLIVSSQPVPEPEALALLVGGLGLLPFLSRKRRQDRREA